MLREFAEQYTVIIVASDTPCGSPDFTPEVAAELMNIGLKIPLHDKHRCSYAAIIHVGQTGFENISPDNAVTAEFELNGHKIAVCSKNYNLHPPYGERRSWIEIDENRRSCERGLTFVIWDGVCNELVYFARFDTYVEIKKSRDKRGYDWAIAYIKKKYPNRRLLTLNSMKFPREDTADKSDNEILSLYKRNRIDKLGLHKLLTLLKATHTINLFKKI